MPIDSKLRMGAFQTLSSPTNIYSFRFPLQIDHLSTEQQKSEIFHSTTPKSYAGLERIKASFHLCAG